MRSEGAVKAMHIVINPRKQLCTCGRIINVSRLGLVPDGHLDILFRVIPD
ncbi:MAG: Uncharacterised protein [SAR116 cluster bacterium]|nr:MAG: Uncharacterised protein [SAR116 cluster bacterium]